jgi:hypothetical protein
MIAIGLDPFLGIRLLAPQIKQEHAIDVKVRGPAATVAEKYLQLI